MQQPAVSSVRWEWINEGWQAFAAKWGMWIVHSLVAFLVMLAVMVPFFILLGLSGVFSIPANGEAPPAPSPFFFLVIAVIYPIIFLVTCYLMAGYFKTALKQLRGEPTSLGDLFSGGDCFLRVAGTLLLLVILGSIGLLFCIFPGLIIYGLCMFALPLTVDKKLGPIAAIQASIEATKKDWVMYTFFALVVYIIASVGAMLCYVGLLASYPLYFLIISVAYRQVFGLNGNSPANYSPPAPPNYGEYNPPPPPSSWQ